MAAAAALLFAGIGFLLLRGGDRDAAVPGAESAGTESSVVILEQPPETDPNGLPMRPHVRLEHPDGAVADVPAEEAQYGEAVDLRRVEVSPGPAWEQVGSGWQFDSHTGIPIQSVTTLDLPTGNEAGLMVIVRTSPGLWVELPSEQVSLRSGEAGLRIRVSAVPAPWTFALARPAAGVSTPNAEEQESLRVEQLYWTDRAAWQKETEAWLETAVFQPSAGSRQASRIPRQVSLPTQYDEFRKHYVSTVRVLGAVRAGIAPGVGRTTPSPSIGSKKVTANALYAAGIKRLLALRHEWLALRVGIEGAADLAWPGRYVDGGRSLDAGERHLVNLETIAMVDAWIEAAMRDYAPWGLDLVAALIEDGTLSDFDLRVLVPYGEERWTDIVLGPAQPSPIDGVLGNELAAIASGATPIVASRMQVEKVLRLYSTRAVDRLAIVDWLKDNVERIVRWLPVGLAAMGVVPGAVGMSIAFAAADEVVNWAQASHDADPATGFATIAFEARSAGALGGASFVIDMWEERALMAAKGRAMLPSHGLTIAQFAYSVGMFAAVRGTDWYVFKTIRDVSTGTHAYCPEQGCGSLLSTVVPPVMFHAIVRGPLAGEGLYPTTVQRLMVWKLEQANLNLHESWTRGAIGPRSALADLPVNDYAPASWPTTVARPEVDVQAIRLSIPKSAIPLEARSELPEDADFSDFGPTVRLRSLDGVHVAFVEVKPQTSRPTPNDRTDTFYVNLFVFKQGVKKFRDEELTQLREGFRTGLAHQVEMSDGLPRRVLSGSVTFEDDDIAPLEFDVDFTDLGEVLSRPILMEPHPDGGQRFAFGDARRLQYLEVSVEAEETIFGIYRFTKFELESRDADQQHLDRGLVFLLTEEHCSASLAECLLEVTASSSALKGEVEGEGFAAKIANNVPGVPPVGSGRDPHYFYELGTQSIRAGRTIVFLGDGTTPITWITAELHFQNGRVAGSYTWWVARYSDGKYQSDGLHVTYKFEGEHVR